MSIPVDEVNPLIQSESPLLAKTREMGHPSEQDSFRPGVSRRGRATRSTSACAIQAGEQVCVITDEATIEIAAAIVHELEKMGAPYHAWVLEDLAPRPLTDMPREILDDLETSQVSIFAVQAQTNELRSRMQMTDVVNRRKIRHAHMVNINRQIMLEGMRADFQKVDRLSQKVVEMVRQGLEDSREDCGRNRPDGGFESELQVAEDQRHYQSGEVGKPAGRRNFHHAGRGEWHVRDRWRGGRLSVREVWRSAGESADDAHRRVTV